MDNLVWAEKKTLGWMRGPQIPQFEMPLHAGRQNLIGADEHHCIQATTSHSLWQNKKNFNAMKILLLGKGISLSFLYLSNEMLWQVGSLLAYNNLG